ncbi:hypothetical protein [Larkinella terrae]|uniref:Uncharacterized protein n=1 Tax=Larkinella terrae TaxID=2025311 RepID=A0A7K0ESC1_9BACT|nr:hypothetical protein [Larkinella terrae]MRS64713.1 hypothetical protein [Larkinella terrae]
MKEALESIRNIHQIIIVVCSAMFVFSIGIKSKNTSKYSELKTEAEFLYKSIETIDSLPAIQVHRFYKDNGVYKIIKDELGDIDSSFVVTPIGFTRIDLYNSYNSIEEINDDTHSIKHYYHTLEEILSDKQVQEVYQFDQDSLRVKLLLNKENIRKLKKINTVAFYIRNLGNTPYLFINFNYGLDNTVEFEILRNFKRAANNTNKKYVSSILINKKLMEIKGQRYIIFPKLSTLKGLSMWDYGLKKAMSELDDLAEKEEKENTTEGLEVAGIKVDSAIAGLVAPSIVIFLLWYLLILIIHLKSSFDKTDKEELKKFPWMGLFNNKYSKITFITSLMILPLTTSISLVIKSDITCKWLLGIFYFFYPYWIVLFDYQKYF